MSQRVSKTIYVLVLLAFAAITLASFVSYSKRHVGINGYSRALFLEMVDGQAHRPFVYRTLMPTTIRLVAESLPLPARAALLEEVQDREWLARLFGDLRWEPRAADRYFVAALLLYFCFVGFGHVTVLLTERVLDLGPNLASRLWMVLGLFVGLPAFFRYASFLYDPPQLFLFSLALLLLLEGRTRAFFFVFVMCCLNKETAIVLVPLFALTCRDRYATGRSFHFSLAGLVLIFVAIKLMLAWVYAANPGGLVETNWQHNVAWILAGWTFPDVFAFLGFIYLVGFGWQAKPRFLRLALLCILPLQLLLAVFFGLVNEWRIFYEVYPVAFACIVDSVHRIDQRLRV